MSGTVIKPPLGIMPKRFWIEERIEALQDAIRRYSHAGQTPPESWGIELSEHMNEIAHEEMGVY